MSQDSHEGITQLLLAWSEGDRGALEQLMPAVYGELKCLARRHLAGERGHTLQATVLVHEAYLKLIDQHSVTWQNRAHFFAIAARLMRRIVVNHARTRNAGKRGNGAAPLNIDDIDVLADDQSIDLLALDDALSRLARVDPRQGEIVELRFFGGLSIEEIATALAISTGTVKREWRTAKAWLHKEIARDHAC
jgi:RNA polymerase sigma-70 factor (ECF subfamily)